MRGVCVCLPSSSAQKPRGQGLPDPPAPLQGLQHLHCPLTPLHGVPSPGRRLLLLQQPMVTGEAGWGHLPPWHSPEAARLPGDGSHHHGLRLGSVLYADHHNVSPRPTKQLGSSPGEREEQKAACNLLRKKGGVGPGVEVRDPSWHGREEEKKWGLWTSLMASSSLQERRKESQASTSSPLGGLSSNCNPPQKNHPPYTHTRVCPDNSIGIKDWQPQSPMGMGTDWQPAAPARSRLPTREVGRGPVAGGGAGEAPPESRPSPPQL